MNYVNIDGSDTFFAQDADMEFQEEGHKYIYKGVVEFTPVSHLYSSFFRQFDALATAKKKALYSDKTAEQFIEEWDIIRERASSIGTFMHRQIENAINGRPVETSTSFDYNGIFSEVHENVDINKEILYFELFRKDLKPQPFRTEWCVYDIDHKVAGTIDLICKNADGTYEMYDWKRSMKIDPTAKGFNNAKGMNGLEMVDDTPFWHYVLQQNTYSYILDKYYGIKVKGMHLVVLHPDYSSFRVLDVPHRPELIKVMLERFKG